MVDPGGPPRRPTMGDVANRAGVSRQLVSLIFRNAPGAGPATTKRVLRAAEELGYTPDTAARMLRRKTSRFIGVLFNPKHAAEADVLDGIYPAVSMAGYEVVLSALTSSRDEGTAIEELLGFRCEALLLIGSHLGPDGFRDLAAKVPVVSVGGGSAEVGTGCDVVRSAGDVGVEQAVDHLCALGHRDITYVHGEKMASAEVRQQGYLRSMSKHGLTPHVLVTSSGYIEESGVEAAATLLNGRSLPSAVVAGNDHAALGVIHALLQAGVDVPRQVSVTGFDDSRVANLSFVALTTINQDSEQLGRLAAEAAVERITGVRSTPVEKIITPTLVVRGSTAPPRGRTAVAG
jgi:DNA-binding LacI/PurR family transcriptional regulator